MVSGRASVADRTGDCDRGIGFVGDSVPGVSVWVYSESNDCSG